MVEVVFTVVDGGIPAKEWLHNGHNEIQGVNRSQESIPIKWLD